MTGNQRLSEIADWRPSTVGLTSEANEYGLPTIVYRTPSSLVEECERAFDAGLLLAALELVVTIPDVCARIAGSDYRTWSGEYLGLVNDGEKRKGDRSGSKTQTDIDRGFRAMERRGVFTASDLYQLRCAVVHAGSSSVDGKGAAYSPFRVIGVCVQRDSQGIIASYGHTGTGYGKQKNCAYDCVIRLEVLISLMAKGVGRFIEEDPDRDREYSTKEGLDRTGVVDYRPLLR